MSPASCFPFDSDTFFASALHNVLATPRIERVDYPERAVMIRGAPLIPAPARICAVCSAQSKVGGLKICKWGWERFEVFKNKDFAIA